MKRLFTVVSLFAVANLAALGAVAAYAWKEGWLERERVLAAAAALRGGGSEDEPADSEKVSQENAAQASSERIRRNEDLEEIYRTEFERRKREIADGWELLETTQVAHLREKEAFEAEKKRFYEEQQRRARQADNSGLKRELKIIEGISPKAAKELLRQKKDADVARLLMLMDTRKARKIVSACKTPEERLWIGRILEQLHESDAPQAEALGAGP